MLDWILGTSTQYVPDLPASTVSANTVNGIGGWDWNTDNNGAWVADPFFKFNLGEYINENVEGIDMALSGSFLSLDLFQESKEYM